MPLNHSESISLTDESMPAPGDHIYVPTIGNIFAGGLAHVQLIVNNYVIIQEHNGASYRWTGGLLEMQVDLKAQFGDQLAQSTGVIPYCSLK